MALRRLALVLPVALAACGKGGSLGAAPDTLQYAVRQVTKSEGECRSQDSLGTPSPCVKLEIVWPEVAGTSKAAVNAHEFIRRLASSSFKDGADRTAPDSVALEALAGHEEMRTKHQGYNVPWTMERKIEVACNRPGQFGLRTSTHQFTGGLHASAAVRFANFDTRTGARYGPNELIAKGQDSAFKQSIFDMIKRDRTVPNIKMDLDSFPMPSSMLACGDSLLVQYDAIVIGPHQMMDKVFRVRRDSVKGLAGR